MQKKLKKFAYIKKILYLCSTFLYIMRNKFFIFIFLSLSLCACQHNRKSEYVIGVSQCLDDAWRQKMKREMEYELVFHPEVELRFRYADGNSYLQCLQIDSFISEGIDLLVVSPNEADEVEPAVSRAFQAGIPVIVADRKVKGDDWTAYIGGDNKRVGYLIAQWLRRYAASNGGHLSVMEVTGLPGSTPTVLRHQAMLEGLRYEDGIRIVAQGCGEWNMDSAERLVDSLLVDYPNVDVIVAQNDLMACGAATALQRHNMDIPVLGVDGLTGPGSGVEAILDGQITVSATYPSRGDIVLTRAMQILHGEAFPRNTNLPSVLIGREEAEPMALLAEEREREVEALAELQNEFYAVNYEYDLQRALTYLLVFIVLILIGICIALWLFLIYAHRIRVDREEKELLLQHQQEQLHSMTELLEQSRRKVPTVQEEERRFVERLSQEIEKHMSDPEMSVEKLAASLGMSRSVLFRKVKAAIGQSPVEMIRHQRLLRARYLLESGTMTVQEVAYEVGFSAPGYFAKCYKEEFGTPPGDEKNRS